MMLLSCCCRRTIGWIFIHGLRLADGGADDEEYAYAHERIFAVMGPGVITAFADNDAGGIATYAAAGATYGYDLLFTLLISTVCLAVAQEILPNRCGNWTRVVGFDSGILWC